MNKNRRGRHRCSIGGEGILQCSERKGLERIGGRMKRKGQVIRGCGWLEIMGRVGKGSSGVGREGPLLLAPLTPRGEHQDKSVCTVTIVSWAPCGMTQAQVLALPLPLTACVPCFLCVSDSLLQN